MAVIDNLTQKGKLQLRREVLGFIPRLFSLYCIFNDYLDILELLRLLGNKLSRILSFNIL